MSLQTELPQKIRRKSNIFRKKSKIFQERNEEKVCRVKGEAELNPPHMSLQTELPKIAKLGSDQVGTKYQFSTEITKCNQLTMLLQM